MISCVLLSTADATFSPYTTAFFAVFDFPFAFTKTFFSPVESIADAAISTSGGRRLKLALTDFARLLALV